MFYPLCMGDGYNLQNVFHFDKKKASLILFIIIIYALRFVHQYNLHHETFTDMQEALA